LWRRVLVGTFVLFLLGLIGFTGYSVYWYLWAAYHLRQAEAVLARRDLDKARAHLALCLKVRAKDPRVQFLAARTARRAGAYDDAERHLGLCKQLGWVPEAISLEWALLQAQRGEPARVEADLLAWVEKDHPDSVYILEALTQGYMRTYEMRRARDCLDLWLERDPDAVQALVWRGDVHERLDARPRALEDYRRAVEIDPERDDARQRLADLLIDSRQAQEALEHYEFLAQRQSSSAAVLLGLARCRIELGQGEEAGRLLDDLLAAQPRHAAALIERGRVALLAGREDEAEAWMHRAVDISPYEQEIVYNYIQCLRTRGKEAEAKKWEEHLKGVEADLRRMRTILTDIRANPRDPDLRHEAGVLMLRNGQEKEGLRWLDSALQINPNHAATHRALADHFEKQGQADLAAHHRRRAERGRGR
jgi:tetratricopeptide (TPR) repeat protein